MAYDAAFDQKYRTYLLEPTVRRAHNYIFDLFHRFARQPRPHVIDLGCGTCELRTFDIPYASYKGFDNRDTGNPDVVIADYLALTGDEIVEKAGFHPNIFASLFSIEPVLEDKHRYSLYERLFRDIPSLHYGVVSGFIYKNRSYYYSVVEEGGIVSYQTREFQMDFMNPHFTEFRTYIEVPSEMFGKDVVEVWKFFQRNASCGSLEGTKKLNSVGSAPNQNPPTNVTESSATCPN
jgi:hypothetical protein